MKAEIIAVGTEILLGDIVDTNSAYIAARLPAIGVDVYWISAVGDNVGRLKEVLERAWSRSDIAITTGGLGPTEDDVTREAIAAMLGEEPSVDSVLEDALRERFRRRGTDMPRRNLKQATLIPSAEAIPNARGTAPGWWVKKDGKQIISMPGVRAEMYNMWDEYVAPRLAAMSSGTVILSRTFKTTGVGEGAVDERLSPILSSTNPSIGVYAKQDGVQVRLTAKATSADEAMAMLNERDPLVKSLLGPIIWGVDDDTLEVIIGKILKEQRATLAVMESCTGGLIANLITDISGSSEYFKGGVVSYTNDVKTTIGVDPSLIEKHTVVSPQVAEAMAEAVRRKLGADVGLAVTGVAGPDPLEGSPPGTVYIGVSGKKGSRSTGGGFYPAGRLEIKRRAAYNALHALRKYLLDIE
ncbi:MAG: competence/damage-inducible protein A [Dehalococcoidia bacterium]|nr:competence/damage-inducible protein A [Dehalococcoidia bacterium]